MGGLHLEGLIFGILRYIDLARAKSEALVNNTNEQKKLSRVRLNVIFKYLNDRRRFGQTKEKKRHGRIYEHVNLP